MKRTLLITFVAVMLVASQASAQGPGGAVGLFATGAGVDCVIPFATAPGLFNVNCVMVLTPSATAIDFSGPAPLCLAPSSYFGFTNAFPIGVGDFLTGISIPFGADLSGPIVLGQVGFFGFGAIAQDCCPYPMMPSTIGDPPPTTITMIDGAGGTFPVVGVNSQLQNGGTAPGTCTCEIVPNKESTWGGVKELFRTDGI